MMTKLTDKETLEQVIQRATNNGWKPQYKVNYTFSGEGGTNAVHLRTDVPIAESFIFDHEFCKALFGEERSENVKVNKDGTLSPKKASKPFGLYVFPKWQYHIQQLVLAEDRIDYLRKYLESTE